MGIDSVQKYCHDGRVDGQSGRGSAESFKDYVHVHVAAVAVAGRP